MSRQLQALRRRRACPGRSIDVGPSTPSTRALKGWATGATRDEGAVSSEYGPTMTARPSEHWRQCRRWVPVGCPRLRVAAVGERDPVDGEQHRAVLLRHQIEPADVRARRGHEQKLLAEPLVIPRADVGRRRGLGGDPVGIDRPGRQLRSPKQAESRIGVGVAPHEVVAYRPPASSTARARATPASTGAPCGRRVPDALPREGSGRSTRGRARTASRSLWPGGRRGTRARRGTTAD